MKKITLLLTLLLPLFSFAQITYEGFLDNKYPITLVTEEVYEGSVQAFYLYQRYDSPIILSGNFKNNTLTLSEKDQKGQVSGIFTLPNFSNEANKVTGKWKSPINGKVFSVSLSKISEVKDDNSVDVLQYESTVNHYFSMTVSESSVMRMRIYQKRTDKYIQAIELDQCCQLRGVFQVSVGDFNFDGIEDFAIFESSYAGANTSSLYYLWDNAQQKYIKSNFQGTSLEFDQKRKRIISSNQCCAGSIMTESVYKVINNKMVLESEECYKWDDTQQKHIKRPMKECN